MLGPRAPSLRQPSSWLIATIGLILHLWAPATLYGLSPRDGPIVPGWVPLMAPVIVYTFIFVCLPRLTVPQRIAGVIALFGLHFLLGLVAEAIYADAGLVPLGLPLEQALWASRTAPLLQLFSVPLVAWPLRDLISGRRRLAPAVPPLALEDFTPPPLRLTPPPIRVAPTPARVTPPAARPAGPPAPSRVESPPAVTATATRWIFVQPAQADPTPAGAETVRALETLAAAPPPAPLSERVERPAAGETPPRPVVTAPPAAEEPPTASGVGSEPAVMPVPPALPALPTPPALNIPPATEAVELPPLETAAAAVEAPPAPAPPALVEGEPAPIVGEITPQPMSPDAVAAVERLCAPLAKVGRLKVDGEVVMGVTLFAVHSPRLARDAVVRDAFRVLARLADCPDLGPIDQITLRGADGAMVLTPLGLPGGASPVIVTAVTHRGSLALLEILARRASEEFRRTAPPAAGAAGEATMPRPAPEFATIAVPHGVGQIAQALGAGGEMRPVALRDAAGRLSLYVFAVPGLDPRTVGGIACQLHQLTEMDGEPGGIGRIHALSLRVGDRRLVIREAGGPGHASLLLAVGPPGGEPGLVHRELERAAERLAAV